MRYVLVIVFLLLLVTLADARTWTDKTGRHKIEAELVGVDSGVVRLRTVSGKVISFPVDRLSKADRKWLEQQGSTGSPSGARTHSEKRAPQNGTGKVEMVADLWPGKFGGVSQAHMGRTMAVFDGALYFRGFTPDQASAARGFPVAYRFCKYDGTKVSPAEWCPSPIGPTTLCVFQGELYFSGPSLGARRAPGHRRPRVWDHPWLWKYDGRLATPLALNATLIRQAALNRRFHVHGRSPPFKGLFPDTFFPSEGFLYFTGAHPSGLKSALWKYDGKSASPVCGIHPRGHPGALPVATVNDELLFLDRADHTVPWKLWRCSKNGKKCAPVMLSKAVSGERPLFWATAFKGDIDGFCAVVFDDEVYFPATTANHGCELWKYDGKAVSMVEDIAPGPLGSGPAWLTVFNDELYFSTVNQRARPGRFLCKYDGKSVSQVAAGWTKELVVFNYELHFVLNQKANVPVSRAFALHKYDGQSVTRLAELPGDAGNLTAFNDEIVFRCDDGVHGWELWRYRPSAGKGVEAGGR